jgi:hypothetical protein
VSGDAVPGTPEPAAQREDPDEAAEWLHASDVANEELVRLRQFVADNELTTNEGEA